VRRRGPIPLGLLISLLISVLTGISAYAQELPAGPERAPVDSAPENSLEPIRGAQRSARLGVAMTMVVPGWGQLYANSPFWGVVAFGVQMYYVGSIVMEGQRMDRASVDRDRFEPGSEDYLFRDDLVTEHRERRRDYMWWAAAGYFVISLDSYVSIELADFDDPGIPTPDMDKDWTQQGSSGEGVALRLNFGF
jgi:hypothetical protein